MRDKNKRRISVLVSAQTAWNLEKLAYMAGQKDIGRVIDKLTREKMLSISHSTHQREKKPDPTITILVGEDNKGRR